MGRLTELADTSAWTNRDKARHVHAEFEKQLVLGEIATCEIVTLELLRASREHGEFMLVREALASLREISIGKRVWRRATDVYQQLALRGPIHHRQVPLADLIVAAAAELAELPVLHYDHHFDVIASVTGQPVRAIAPLGSL